jgi:hypothetical protein
LSFGIMNWQELGRRYPKAKQALAEIRDRDLHEFSEGRGYSQLFSEVQSLDRSLNDDDATVTLFKSLVPKDKQLSGQCFAYVEGSLMQKGDYQLCLDFIGDPQGSFESARRMLEMQRESQQRMAETAGQIPAAHYAGRFRSPDMGQLATNNFVGQVCVLVEILVATGHKADAEKIRDEALTVLDDARLKSAVGDAEAKVQLGTAIPSPAEDDLLVRQPPVVVETYPPSGATEVTPGEMEIRVRFSKPMMEGAWSWVAAWENSTPEMVGQPHYLDGHYTCVLKVRLEPGKSYAWWLNHDEFKGFVDHAGQPAVPYLLTFETKSN